MMEFSERLREALEIRDMKAIDLADKLGVTRGVVSNYLSGKRTPKSVRLCEIAKALRVQETWLMGYDVEMERPLHDVFVESDGNKYLVEIVNRIREMDDERLKALCTIIRSMDGK